MKKWTNKQGFTLAELLIVVAIIAVLVAISIPVFAAQLEKSRESTDAANIRAAYAEIMVKAIDNPGVDGTEDAGTSIKVTLRQQETGWQNTDNKSALQNIFAKQDATNRDAALDAVGKDKTATITWKAATTGESAVEGHVEISVA